MHSTWASWLLPRNFIPPALQWRFGKWEGFSENAKVRKCDSLVESFTRPLHGLLLETRCPCGKKESRQFEIPLLHLVELV